MTEPDVVGQKVRVPEGALAGYPGLAANTAHPLPLTLHRQNQLQC